MAKVFSVVAQVPTTQGPRNLPASRERHVYTKISPAELDAGKGSLDSLARTVKAQQDNVAAATLPYRSNPLLHGEVHRAITFVSGEDHPIKHGLGEAFGSWKCVRAYAGSAPFAAVETGNNNGGYDPKQYLCLHMSSSGTYDIEINPA